MYRFEHRPAVAPLPVSRPLPGDLIDYLRDHTVRCSINGYLRSYGLDPQKGLPAQRDLPDAKNPATGIFRFGVERSQILYRRNPNYRNEYIGDVCRARFPNVLAYLLLSQTKRDYYTDSFGMLATYCITTEKPEFKQEHNLIYLLGEYYPNLTYLLKDYKRFERKLMHVFKGKISWLMNDENDHAAYQSSTITLNCTVDEAKEILLVTFPHLHFHIEAFQAYAIDVYPNYYDEFGECVEGYRRADQSLRDEIQLYWRKRKLELMASF